MMATMQYPVDTEQTKTQREDRVLTLLHLLGPEAAEQVLGRLDSQTMSLLKNRLKEFAINPPPVRKQQQVLEEFERFFQFALTSTRSSLKLHNPGWDAAEDSESPEPEVYPPSGDPLIDLEKMNMYQLAGALEEEQPRTVALLLRVVTPKRVAQILNLLPEDKRELVVREMSRDPRAPEIILRRIAATTVDRAAALPPEPRKKDDPVQRMVEVLRATDKPRRRTILKSLEEQDPDKAAQISRSLYQFDDLAAMPDQQIQKVLARIDSTTLSTALYGAEEKIVGKIMGNLSKRARASLQEEMSFLRNVAAAQIRASRELVVQAIAESEQEEE